jgi:hypothetical protein
VVHTLPGFARRAWTSALLVDKLALAWYRHRCVQAGSCLYRRRLHGCGPSLTVEVYADIMPSPTSAALRILLRKGMAATGPLAPAPFLSGASAVDECVSVCRHARLVRSKRHRLLSHSRVYETEEVWGVQTPIVLWTSVQKRLAPRAQDRVCQTPCCQRQRRVYELRRDLLFRP